MTKANWMRYAVMLFCCLISHLVWADIVLVGSINIGDNSSSVINPTALVGQSNGVYTPGSHPFHFTLSQSGVVTQVKVNSLSGSLHGVSFVVWNSAGQVVISQTATDAQPSLVSGSWMLAAGDYRMAVWGQCIKESNSAAIAYSYCLSTNGQQEWDDISFTNISLTGINSPAINFIQRLHLGDNSDATRWYPPSPSANVSVSDAASGATINSTSTGASVTYSFATTTDMTLTKLMLFKMNDWQTASASRIQLRQKNSSTYLWQYSFTTNGDLSWQPNLTLSPGNYELVVSTDDSSGYDADDMNWDDVVITTEPYTLTYQCSDVFPYPIQGRTNTDYVNLASNKYGYIAGRIWGSQGGKLGYQSSSQILNLGSTSNGNAIVDGNCDNKQCTADKLAGAIALPSSPFPLASGTSFTLSYNQSRTLTAADGSNFGTITTNYQSSLNFSVSGITIKSLNVGSDLPGKAYTVKFTAGEYWIENLTMGDSASIVLDGDVILHVKNMSMNSANLLNSAAVKQSGTVSKLLLVIYDSLYLGNRSTVSGLVYQTDSASGAITLSSASYIYGRVNAHNIQFGDGSVVDSSGYSCSGTTPAITINHYEIRYPAGQITCEPAAITINACTNSDTSSCTKDTTASSSITLSAPASGWSSNPVTLTNGSGSVSLSHYAAGNVTLGLSSSTASYTCFKNGVADSTCQLPFVSSAFTFDFPTFYAGSNSGNVTLKAVQASASNPAVCTTLFANKTQNVSFSSQYVLPASGTVLPTLNGSSFSGNAASLTLPLTFDSSGAASLNLAYNDAGVLGITAQTTIADSAAGTLSVSGSDNVAVLPTKILMSAVGQTACSGSSDKAYASCAVYKAVDQTFTLSASAGYLNGSTWNTTANFSTVHLAASALPTLQHQLVAPSAGTLPALSSTSLSFTGGTATAPLSERDIGVYQYGVTAFVPYSDYQNELPKLTVPLTWSDPVGRFIPAKLQASGAGQGALTTATCVDSGVNATLGYTGQSLHFSTSPRLSVTALGRDGVTVMKNYQGYFAKITDTNAASSGQFIAALLPKNSVNSLTSNANWSDVLWDVPVNAYTPVYTFSANNQFTFNKVSTPVTPFETVLTVTTLKDSDGVSAVDSLPLNFYPTSSNGSVFNVYSGRLTLDNVNAAETSALALPFYMQYWNGTAYVINNADNCSMLTTNALSMNGQSSWAGIPLRVSTAVASNATSNASLSVATVSNGSGLISFSAPNATGWIDLLASSSLPLWMQDLSTPAGLLPARASFGFYRGNDRVIYRREVFGGQ